MKLSIFVVFCLFLTLQYESVSCGVVQSFLEKGHEVIETVRKDVQNVFHLNKNEKDDKVAEKENSDKETEPEKISTTTELNKTEKKENTETKNEDKNEVLTTTAKSSSTTASTDKIAAPEESSAESQQGRENFKASCASGYKRTADGRCKPTY
ncbi:paralytic/GBP/PSP peptide domain-containing protein [Phthorimaea operculella]|nr:paralytic/GBP/PSP peptide domain-containing protein [Phthorimaea operculella]